MTIEFIYHDNEGRIVASGTNTSLTTISMSNLGDWVLLTGVIGDPRTQYVKGGSVLQRTAFPGTFDKLRITADGSDEAILNDVPTGTVINADGVSYTVDDGAFEFSASSPGTYIITVNEPQYLEEVWRIDAV